ncbi:sodium / potassium ATPase beta chain domain-containing protein [Phthorimaea operculella]|nr:sodium / potassium ATPase beta chain domain-containing protein [Phthorimaea operculella]
MHCDNWARAPVVDNSPTWLKCLKIIYNPEEKSFFGRTGKRWAIVLAFYTVFYIVLALLFSCCFGVMMLTIDDTKPKWTLEKSLIGKNKLSSVAAIVLVFYTVFYIVLALLVSCCFGVMMLTIDDTKPKWTLEKSLIGKNKPRSVAAIVLVFYIVLALLFSCCFGVMMLTIDDTKPKWTLQKSLIGKNKL